MARGIWCNAICPGTVESPDRLRAQGDDEAPRAAFVARQSIGRIGQLDEIAALVLYLATATDTAGPIHVTMAGPAEPSPSSAGRGHPGRSAASGAPAMPKGHEPRLSRVNRIRLSIG